MRVLIWAVFLLGFAIPAADDDWDITDYNVDITVQPDGKMNVIETIDVDFTREAHHGIYRLVLVKYEDRLGSTFRYRFKLDSVTDENGAPYTVKVSRQGRYVNVRIGDPDRVVQQRMVYNIAYTLDRGIRFFDSADEVYWNPIGHEWGVPIGAGRCVVHLPQPIEPGRLQCNCWTGPYGSRARDASIDAGDGQNILFVANRSFGPQEGMTVFVGLPKGVIKEPERVQRIAWFTTDNGMWFLPPIMLIGFTMLWYRVGRDPDPGRSVTTAYDPPDGLSPAEVGTLIDERINPRDITATIVDFAVRGYLRIELTKEKLFIFEKTEYKLVKLKEPGDELTPFERYLMTSLFDSKSERLISDLKNKFYTHLPELKKRLYVQLKKKGYLDTRFDTVRSHYLGAGIAIMVAAGIVGAITGSLMWGLALACCGLIVVAFSPVMPRKTLKGARAFQAIRGFEDYLATAEKDMIELQQRQGFFDKFLPYAMVLNVSDQWARAFDGIMTAPPSWFAGAPGSAFHPSVLTSDAVSTFNPALFAHDMNAASDHISSGLTSSPSSSGGGGGGFSGGGGGGGGGGAW
jgi:uncharacterized membrane protein